MDSNPAVVMRADNGRWLSFRGASAVLETDDPARVQGLLREVEEAVSGGLKAAGFVTYEAASGMDRALCSHPRGKLPLAWFTLFRDVEEVDALPPAGGTCRMGPWKPSVTREQYDGNIARIRRYLRSGDTYQVNYTLRMKTACEGNPYAFFLLLQEAQDAPYGAYIETGSHAICCASPELFFRLRGADIESKPMKGTRGRGLTWEQDEESRTALAASEKDRAENIMIVDMIRNDLGRVCEMGSVTTKDLFEIQRFPTLFQMISTVHGRTDAGLAEIFAALFPCASITGAPKVRTMEIIRELEDSPRGLYTGAVGYVLPGRKACFNVAIRTVVVDVSSGQAEYGVGGGIVWDSTADREYEECLTKAQVLTVRLPAFELLETLRWDHGGGYSLLESHIKRLLNSARYFGFQVTRDRVARALEQAAGTFGRESRRVRLLADRRGGVRVESAPLGSVSGRPRVKAGLARDPVDETDRFLYHKTTHRAVYERAKQSRPGCDDVILWNRQGEVTESCIANLVIEKDGKYITPPVPAGLLPGTFRAHLIEKGEVSEQTITVDDLRAAKHVFLVNSVRGWMDVDLEEG